MPEQHALFFAVDFSDTGSGTGIWRTEMDLAPQVNDPKNPPYGIRRIFHYFDMYVCILDDDGLGKGNFGDFTSEEVAQAPAGDEKDKLSYLMTNVIIKPIIESIIPQVVDDPRFNFRWELIPLNELTWPDPAPTTTNELIVRKDGASGGGSRGDK